MKSQVDDAELAERKLLEVRLCRIGSQKNRARLWQVGSNRFDLMAAFWKRNKLAPFRTGDRSMDACKQCVRRRIGSAGCPEHIRAKVPMDGVRAGVGEDRLAPVLCPSQLNPYRAVVLSHRWSQGCALWLQSRRY